MQGIPISGLFGLFVLVVLVTLIVAWIVMPYIVLRVSDKLSDAIIEAKEANRELKEIKRLLANKSITPTNTSQTESLR